MSRARWVFGAVACGTVGTATAQTPLASARVASGLSNPVFAGAPSADFTRLFIVEQRGSGGQSARADLRILRLSDNALLPTPFLTINPVATGNEQGLLGLAFHPGYAQNRRFYVNYTDENGDTVIERYTASPSDPNLADPNSGLVLMTIDQPQSNHNGGWLGFGPDGYLYIASGDGGGGGDQGSGHHATLGNGQFLGTRLGKMLRIDVDTPAGGLNYSIPAGNPFVASPTAEPEVWAYGLRNPWRCSFDRLTGRLFIADVGQGAWEEINVQAPGQGGLNYGWRCHEGNNSFNTANCAAASGMTFPVHVYDHATGCSVTGGYVYRGSAIPDLRGTYFFADYCSGSIWSLATGNLNNPVVADRTEELAPGGGQSISSITSFGEDARGELYVVDGGGEVFRIRPRPPFVTAVTPSSLQADAQFGASVAGCRDLNGDGRGDLIVGSALLDFAGGVGDAGRVQVHNGFTGALIRTHNPPNLQAGGMFGASVAGLDNVNGDSLGDYVVGAPRQHPGAAPLNAGRAYVFNGGSGGLLRVLKSPNEQAGSLFGWSVGAVPDANGDGRTDFLIGAPGETVGTAVGAGRVYLFSGASGILLRTFRSPVYEAGGNFGWSVAGVPDATGDGRGDILIGAPREDPGSAPTDTGRVFLYNGATGAFLKVFGSPSQEAGGNFGWSVAGVPDATGDGRGEVLIGAPGESPGATPARSGRAYLFSGATGAYLRTLASPNAQANGEFATCVAGVADATGDGRGDVVIGAPRESVGGLGEGGRAYIVNGATGTLYQTLASPANEAGGRFGSAVGAAPDVNGNSRGEVLVRAPREDPANAPSASGRTYLIRN